MKSKTLYILWAVLFILCAGLGFIPNPDNLGKAVLILLGIGFFVPGGVLLHRAGKRGDVHSLRIIRSLSLLSLALTFLTLVLNFALVRADEAVGAALYAVLVVVSSPMVCIQFWALGMFGWACLLMVSLSLLRKRK
ncbi:MAG TPA: hypothetical protein IAC31_06490 [Candidatus Faecousia intestinigallinarum]|nr:hypothetical protein [Candidatus Faecousia intestinigallinarum]